MPASLRRGQLGFGCDRTNIAGAPSNGDLRVRHGLDGVVVTDAMVGGIDVRGGVDFFNNWGSLNHSHSTTLVAQNQSDGPIGHAEVLCRLSARHAAT